MDRIKQELQIIVIRRKILLYYLLKKIAFKYKNAKYQSHNYSIDPTTHF